MTAVRLRLLLLIGISVASVINAQNNPHECAYLTLSPYRYSFWTCITPIEQDICGTRSQVKYDCCPGYEKGVNSNQCLYAQSAWKNSVDYLKTYSSSQFSSSNFMSFIQSQIGSKDGIFTIFAPYGTNGINDANVAAVMRNRVYSKEFVNGAQFKTLPVNGKERTITITAYSNGLIFANCRPLVKPDVEALNGVVHYFSEPLAATVSLTDTMQSQRSISSFFQKMPQKYKDMLRQGGRYTVFAPSNSKMAQSMQGQISENCLDQYYAHHIVPEVYCSIGITNSQEKKLGPTLANQYISVGCDNRGPKVFSSAGSSYFSEKDIMASNGVLHVVDADFLPYNCYSDYSQAFSYAVTDYGVSVSKTVQYMRECQMNFNQEGILLVPVDIAYNNFPMAQKFMSDRQYRCSIIKGLLIPYPGVDKIRTGGLRAGVTIMNTGITPYYIKNKFGTRLFFNRAMAINRTPFSYGNVIFYLVSRISEVPTMSSMQVLQGNADLSSAAKNFQNFHNKYLVGKSGYTIFAPRNNGWSSRKEGELSPSELQNFLALHTAKIAIHDNQIERDTIQEIPSMYSTKGKSHPIKIWRKSEGTILIGHDEMPLDHWGHLVQRSIATKEGSVWIMDWPLHCPAGGCTGSAFKGTVYSLSITAVACKTNVAPPSLFLNNGAESIYNRNKGNCVSVPLETIVQNGEMKIVNYVKGGDNKVNVVNQETNIHPIV